MSGDFHKPALFSGRELESSAPAEDPTTALRAAHDSAAALVTRVRESGDAAVVDRMVRYPDEHGIDALAELWARAAPRSLPGALWRLYLVRAMIRADPDGVSLLFARGTEVLRTIDPVVAGAPTPAGPQEVVELADRILRGAFDGDLAVALDRAAAFCRLTSSGATSIADDQDVIAPERAEGLTTRASRLSTTADELSACARLARDGLLD